MQTFIIEYVFIAFLVAAILNILLNKCLENETDFETLELFSDNKVKYASIIILSVFWFVTLSKIVYDNIKEVYRYV